MDKNLNGKQDIIKSIINNSAVATFVVDSGHKVMYWNKACEELTGTKAENFIGTKDHWKAFYKSVRPCVADIIIDENIEEMAKLYDSHAQSTLIKGGLHAEGWYKGLGGKDRYIIFDAAPIHDSDGTVMAAIETLQDVTDLKRTEEELEKAYTVLQKTQAHLIETEKTEAIGRIAAGVAHEVKNPLGVILQGAEYLEGKCATDQKDVLDIFKMIKNNVRKADKIIRALVDFSKEADLHIQEEDINLILDNSLVLIQYTVKMDSIEVIKKMGSGLPRVLADRVRMEQVFINVFLNAVQAMPEGGKIFVRSYVTKIRRPEGKVGVRGEENFEPEEQVVAVEIEDTGIGIPEENLNKVFEPFFTTRGPQSGTGLGLAITSRIVDLHKGSIEISSIEGKGTIVKIFLKLPEDSKK